jgi:hypothetical protein
MAVNVRRSIMSDTRQLVKTSISGGQACLKVGGDPAGTELGTPVEHLRPGFH